MPTNDCHPELDASEILNVKQHRQYQQLLGMGIWMVVIGRVDICFAISSLGRFGACPRVGHLDLLLHVFGYLKQFKKKRIAIDSTPINYDSFAESTSLICDFLQDYPDVKKQIRLGFPEPYDIVLKKQFLLIVIILMT